LPATPAGCVQPRQEGRRLVMRRGGA
jgi:hypothetical protein